MHRRKKRIDLRTDISACETNYNHTLLVLANGPSLGRSLEKYLSEFIQNTVMCVNSFVHTEYFELLKPEYYVLADPNYFHNREKVESENNREIIDLVNELKNKTTWKMTLIIPENAVDSYVFNALSECGYIDIKVFSYLLFEDISLYFSKKEIFGYLSRNMIRPTTQTVLNTGVCMGLILGYKEIYIYGADISMFETLELDQLTNKLYIIDTHFYDSKRIPHVMNVAESFQEYATMFKESMFLDEFSRYLGARIYNASEKSWIDAYERKVFKEQEVENEN